mgnify:CR=1 FL=1
MVENLIGHWVKKYELPSGFCGCVTRPLPNYWALKTGHLNRYHYFISYLPNHNQP